MNEGIAELIEEIQSLHVNIADQAMEYIHAEYVVTALPLCDASKCTTNLIVLCKQNSEVILTFGQSTSVEEFLKTAAKKRQFKVIAVESAPTLNGQQMAHSLSENGIDVTVIPDSAVFAMMARVNKVVIPAAAVVANGGLIAQSGLQNIALAAKKYSVPVVCVAGLIKLCPLYAHDLDVLNELIAPSNIYNYEDTVENVRSLHIPSCTWISTSRLSLLIVFSMTADLVGGVESCIRLRATRVCESVYYQHWRAPAIVHLSLARGVLFASRLPISIEFLFVKTKSKLGSELSLRATAPRVSCCTGTGGSGTCVESQPIVARRGVLLQSNR